MAMMRLADASSLTPLVYAHAASNIEGQVVVAHESRSRGFLYPRIEEFGAVEGLVNDTKERYQFSLFVLACKFLSDLHRGGYVFPAFNKHVLHRRYESLSPIVFKWDTVM